MKILEEEIETATISLSVSASSTFVIHVHMFSGLHDAKRKKLSLAICRSGPNS